MRNPPYFRRVLVNAFILLPLLFQVLAILVALLAGLVIDGSSGLVLFGLPFGGLFLWHCIRSGRQDIRKAAARFAALSAAEASGAPVRFQGDPRFLVRYLPVLLPVAYTLLVALGALLLPVPTEGAIFGKFASIFTLSHLPACFLLGIVYLFGVPSLWWYLLPSLAIYAA